MRAFNPPAHMSHTDQVSEFRYSLSRKDGSLMPDQHTGT
jgi:hypothetical protein